MLVHEMDDVLADIYVLDFCWIGAGSIVTQMLAFHGAQVIKIESRQRPDNLRLAPPSRPGTSGLNASGYFSSRNANKKSFALNMSDERAMPVVKELLAKCSVITSNFRPGVMERWGLDYDSLRPARPDLIYLSMPMQGEVGPYREDVGFGSTIAALAGLVAPSGLPDRRPVGTGTNYPDHIPNPGHALVALIAAILHRRKTGRGGRIELSQLETTVNMMGPSILAFSVNGKEPVAEGNRSSDRCPQGVFRCAGDDKWCAISVGSKDQWQATINTLGLDELAHDSRFMTFADRKNHEGELEALIGSRTIHFEARDLMNRLQAVQVPSSVVNSAADVYSDPTITEREYWHMLHHEVLGETLVAGPPFQWSDRDVSPRRAAPLLGEHTLEIWTDLLGRSVDSYERFVDEGVLW
jgi:benzylsuccinate CoA-transferase BbsF subunit